MMGDIKEIKGRGGGGIHCALTLNTCCIVILHSTNNHWGCYGNSQQVSSGDHMGKNSVNYQ